MAKKKAQMIKTLKINEVFRSLQGEGLYQGEPTVFIRLQGCNLRCKWCDTPYAQEVSNGWEWSPEEVLEEVRRLQMSGWVCITGGEPLMQDQSLSGLVGDLWECGYKVEIETNGWYPLPYWHSRVHSWVLDVKCPSSGNLPLMGILGTWEELTSSNLQIKFVVQDLRDLAFVLLMKKRKLFHHQQYIVSPVFMAGSLDPAWGQEVAQFCLDHDCRLSLQYHKILWGDAVGV